MAKVNSCDNCGKAFEPKNGFAVAVMVGDRPGAPFFEAPQFQEACTLKCIGELASKTAVVRREEVAAAEAHRAQVEKDAEVERARAERQAIADAKKAEPPVARGQAKKAADAASEG